MTDNLKIFSSPNIFNIAKTSFSFNDTPYIPNIDFTVLPDLNSCRNLLFMFSPSLYAIHMNILPLHGGLSNQMFIVMFKTHRSLVVKIFDDSTKDLLSREDEIRNMIFADKFACKVLAKFNNGFIYEYRIGEVLKVEHLYIWHIIQKIATKMKKLHSLPLTPDVLTLDNISTRTLKWLELLKYSNFDEEKLDALSSCFCAIEDKINSFTDDNSPNLLRKTFIHGDINVSNVVLDDVEEDVHFIDYEFSCVDSPMFDIANHFCEYGGNDISLKTFPLMETRMFWYSHYFEEDIDVDLHKFDDAIMLYVLKSHIYWSVWSFLKNMRRKVQCEEQGKYVNLSTFDYESYATKRLQALYDHDEYLKILHVNLRNRLLKLFPTT